MKSQTKQMSATTEPECEINDIIIITFRLYDDLIYPNAGSYSHSVYHFTVINSSFFLWRHTMREPSFPVFRFLWSKLCEKQKVKVCLLVHIAVVRRVVTQLRPLLVTIKPFRVASQITNSMRQLSISWRPRMKQMRHPERTYDWWQKCLKKKKHCLRLGYTQWLFHDNLRGWFDQDKQWAIKKKPEEQHWQHWWEIQT